jgi:hypothetical protein
MVPAGVNGSRPESRGWRLSREIEAPDHIRPGYVAIAIESKILEKLRPDMRDLRLVDSKGVPNPIILRPSSLPRASSPYPARVFRVVREHDQWTDIWIDKTAKSLAECLIINTPSNGFIRNVEIRGSDNARDAYVIRQDGLIAAFGAPVKLRSLDIKHPINNFQYLHVRIHDNGETPIKIAGAHCCPPRDPNRPHERPIRIVDIKSGPDNEKLSIIGDLGESRHPVCAINISSGAEDYLAGAKVFASNSPGGDQWELIHSGVVFKLEKNGAVKERTKLGFQPNPSRRFKLELEGKIPEVEGLTADFIIMALIFKYEPNESYRLIYRNPDITDRGPVLSPQPLDLKKLISESKDIQIKDPKRIKVKKAALKEPKEPAPEFVSKLVSFAWKICGIVALLLGLLLIFRAMLKKSRRRPGRF